MAKLPTGDEPPKGFERYVEDKWRAASRTGVQIGYVGMNQLSRPEIVELEKLRDRALENFMSATGHELHPLPIEEELELAPEGKSISDKLLFRAYNDGTLVAYAHVIMGWPKSDEWAIEQLLLDPVHRLQGIGSRLIAEVEEVARTAEVKATSILSLPTRPDSESFWKHVGYTDKTEELAEDLGNAKDFVNILRKELS